jgi:D-3-phosphoglycerate dehydrogenase
VQVLVADKFEKSGLEGLKSIGCAVAYEPESGTDRIAALAAQHKPAILVVRSTKVPGSVVAALPAAGVKVIIRAGAGVDNIDSAAATAAGIKVCNCPGMNAIAVAELTMGLILACDRRIAEQTIEARAGKWNKKEYAKARGLKGLTLGLVGLGAIGKAVAQRAKAFDMRVVGWSRSLTPQSAGTMGVEFGGSDRAALLKMVGGCDVVSVHVAGAPETKQMCNAEFFNAMKQGAYFINTSRGTVVDENALRDAITAKGLRAGLDVYDNQPATPQADWTNSTVGLHGVVATHHCGASTDQAQSAVADETVRIVKVFKETGRAENAVN